MELAITLGGGADIAKVDPRERREHKATNVLRTERVISSILLTRTETGVPTITESCDLQTREDSYSLDAYRQCATGMWVVSNSYGRTPAEASCGYLVALRYR